ncbi:MAG: hypothetical protein LBC12_08000 [Nitrososphaerota archaeon]|nr:hypothetical protein [Nitrososphaerota archaeon]
MKALCVLFYALDKSYGMLGKIVGRDRVLIYRWIREAELNTEEPLPRVILGRWGLMRCCVLWVQKKQAWVLKALDRSTR